MTKKQVFVFLDWQNVYMRAREAFFDPRFDPPAKGQVNPVDLAATLAADYARRHSDDEVELSQVHIYRGRPLQSHDPKGYDAFRRQDGAWRHNRKVHTHYRDLRYPWNWGEPDCADKPREKGVDVELALDVVTLGLEGAYDVGIVMSADYDLTPALDYMVRRRISRDAPDVEVASWKSDQGDKPLRIRLSGRPLYCIWLDRQTFWGLADDRDYSIPAPARHPGGPRPGPYRSST